MKTINVKYIDTTAVVCNITYEEYPESPRTWDNLGKMVLKHNKYHLAMEADIDFDDFVGWDEVEKYLRNEHEAYIVLPVQMHEHSSINIYVGDSHDRWDGGQLGFIFATREDIKTWFEVERITQAVRERAIACLTAEVDDYSKYIDGECYRFTLERAADGAYIDSCGGYYNTNDIKAELSEYENIIYKFDGVEQDWL